MAASLPTPPAPEQWALPLPVAPVRLAPPPPVRAVCRRRVWEPHLDWPRLGPTMRRRESNLAEGRAVWTVLEVSLQHSPEVSLRRSHPFGPYQRRLEVSLQLLPLFRRRRLEVSLQLLPPFPLYQPSSGVLGVSP